MKASTTLIALALLTATSAMADDMKDMPGMSKPANPAAKTGKATGVITALDTKANTVTIKHGPIPAVSWPAMTMTFKATSPTLLKSVKVGQKVGFDVKVAGSSNEVTAIRPM
jgi:Cu(I)/Ag(I) efflux system protein CusF